MKISIEKIVSGRYCVLGDDVRLHVVGDSISDALRCAADFLEKMNRCSPGHQRKRAE